MLEAHVSSTRDTDHNNVRRQASVQNRPRPPPKGTTTGLKSRAFGLLVVKQPLGLNVPLIDSEKQLVAGSLDSHLHEAVLIVGKTDGQGHT